MWGTGWGRPREKLSTSARYLFRHVLPFSITSPDDEWTHLNIANPSPLTTILHYSSTFFFFFQSTRNDPSDTTLIAYICEIDLILIVTCHISRINQQWTRAFLTSCYRIIRQKQDQHHNETCPRWRSQIKWWQRQGPKRSEIGRGRAKKLGHSLLLTDLIIREKIKEAAKKRMKMGRFNRPAKQMANDSTWFRHRKPFLAQVFNGIFSLPVFFFSPLHSIKTFLMLRRGGANSNFFRSTNVNENDAILVRRPTAFQGNRVDKCKCVSARSAA